MKTKKSFVTAFLVISSTLITSCAYFSTDSKTVSTSNSARTIASEDDETPAQETVCDELIGQTPRFYGLCVAYCEAQDGPTTIDGEIPLEDQDLSVPNRKILANYDKKMRDGDPKMPCVNYTTSCPLWSYEELYAIGTHGGYTRDISRVLTPEREVHFDEERGGGVILMAQIRSNYRSVGKMGYYLNRDLTGYNQQIYRIMPLTDAEYDSCKQQIIDHVARPSAQ